MGHPGGGYGPKRWLNAGVLRCAQNDNLLSTANDSFVKATVAMKKVAAVMRELAEMQVVVCTNALSSG